MRINELALIKALIVRICIRIRGFLALFLIAAPIMAHHSLAAEFDTSRPVTLHGKITKVSWMNPHVFVWIDAADANGKVANWEVESAAPNYLQGLGWGKESVKAGDTATIRAWIAKDQANLAKMDEVTLPSGKHLVVGHPGGEKP